MERDNVEINWSTGTGGNYGEDMDNGSHNDFQEIGLPPKKVMSYAGLSLFVLSFVVLGVQSLLDLLARSTVPWIVDTDWYVWALTAISIVGIGFPVYYAFIRRIPDSPKGKVEKLKPTRFIMIFFICYMAMYFTNLMSTVLTLVISLVKGEELVNPVAEAIIGGNFLITLLYAAVIAPIIEEVIFRKLLLDKVRRFGELPAILITGIAFGLFHMNLSQFFYAAVLGFIFAYVVLKTNTIRYSILLHMMINFISSVMAPVLTKNKFIFMAVILLWIGVALTLGVVFAILNYKKVKLEKYQPVMKTSSFFLNTGTILYLLTCLAVIVYATVS
ncbi:MAG TPA: CPBP family intramembrane metalloprotease [Clostridiales bacterium]|nr:CPBP family intramembrane metalloprotease [Clostridiales bacterium]